MVMNPPPPMFPASIYVTASANPVAIAASTALPPLLSISWLTSDPKLSGVAMAA